MIDFDPFSGPDRLEHVQAFSRLFRMGKAEDLYRSDPEILRTRLSNRDLSPDTKEYLAYFHGLNVFMLDFIYQWLLHWRTKVEGVLKESERTACMEKARASWLAAAEAWDGDPCSATHRDVVSLLEDRVLIRKTQTSDGNTGGQTEPSCPVCRVPNQNFEALLADIETASPDENIARFNDYLLDCRVRHDLMLRLVWSLTSAVVDSTGQGNAVQALAGSLQACSQYEGMFELAANLSPRGLAALLAEHLRSHFSGPGREGAVRVIEEPDCFRLVMDPCGSGGAMRRMAAERGSEGLAKLPEASPCTWGRAGEVPAYCAHCAQNELKSLQRLGYPVLVTEFDPDPSKPCGWTIYKSPSLIPERYFTRLGAKKDSTKFRND